MQSIQNKNQEIDKFSLVYTNITSTFSGIGYVIIDLNSIVSIAITKYNLDVKTLPTQTVFLYYEFIKQNLKKYQLRNLEEFYEYTSDDYFNVLLRSINKNGSDYSKIKETVENKRIALAITSGSRDVLSSYFLSMGIYVGMLETVKIQVPFVYALIYKPFDYVKEEIIYESFTNTNEYQEDDLDKICITESEILACQDKFFDYTIDTREIKIEISPGCVKQILKHDISNIDGRILSSLRNNSIKYYGPDDNRVLSDAMSETPSLPWSGRDIQLLQPSAIKPVSARHLANLRRSALSLYDGKFHFSSVVKQTKSTVKVGAKMQKIIQENEVRLHAEARKKDDTWLKAFFSQYSKLSSLKEKRGFIEYMKVKNAYIHRKILLLKIELYSSTWNLERRKDDIDESQILPVYLACIEYVEKYALGASKETPLNNSELEFVLSKLFESGFESTCLELINKLNNDIPMNLDPKVLFPDFTSNAKPNDFDLYIQLKYGGEHLKRTLGTSKDSRVPFDPDRWQVELLDAVDTNKTAVISAPTSSGKTFICFYAIEKILKSSDTDVVVFCLPTKALVNQVSSDIFARFNPKNIKVSLQGTLMPDRGNDPFNCQVLITIPSMLESLLNSKNVNMGKIKYIIIDEIHKINDVNIGINIERIIHMAQCPMLLLSATLGNLNTFYEWVNKIEESKGRECKLVVHRERYCELKTFVFSRKPILEKNEHFENGTDVNSQKNNEDTKTENKTLETVNDANTIPSLVPLNNMFAYSFNHLKTFGFGNDLHFLPDELLNIYYYIYMVLPDDSKKLIKSLAPKKYFKSNILCKNDIAGYQTHLLSTFETWVKDGILSQDQVQEVHSLLTKDAVNAFPVDTSEQYLMDNILDLLNKLKDDNMLPVIVFNTDRDLVTRLAKHVYTQLESRDIKKKKDKAVERFMKEVKRNRNQEKTKNSWIDDSILSEQAAELLPEERDINYTFLDQVTKLTDYDVKEELRECISAKVPKDLLDMAYRGIGIHHSAMNRTYRSAMEILFRKKHVRVLFATDTLALGINMPCRTTVFAGDSLYLDPMNFKQMSGRAGRRGYDTLGNVIFFGISKPRAQNLMVSNLPEIQGGYTYSNTSLTAFDSIQNSLINYPLMGFSSIESHMASISIKTPVLTLSCFGNSNSRSSFVEYQKSAYPFIYPSNYLWDLQISNREFDPSIFIFSYLYHLDVLSYEPLEFMNTIAHFFETIPIEPTFTYSLSPLTSSIQNVLDKLNSDYLVHLSKFSTSPIKNLQSYSSEPLFIINSFLSTNQSPLNSYLVDFYKHGSTYKINKYNKVGTGQLWASLNNISTFLTSLIRMMEELSDPRAKLVTSIFTEFDHGFRNIFA